MCSPGRRRVKCDAEEEERIVCLLATDMADSDAKKNLPPMLNSDKKPAKPAAMVATSVRSLADNCAKPTPGRPISSPPKISCSIGEAMPITPMPAETLRHSTAQISQNCTVLCASFRWTWCWVIIALLDALGVQPSGRQPVGGSR
jgi:hypothetical protein